MNSRRLTLLSIAVMMVVFLLFTASCKKPRTMLYPYGTFPDTAVALANLNTQYDDYNVNLDYANGYIKMIFSSNRNTQGGTFDLVTGAIEFTHDKYTGQFTLGSELINDAFLTALITAANTQKDDLGPYRLLSTADSHEYLLITTESDNGDTDIKYLRYLPQTGTNIPAFGSLTPAAVLNSSSDDGYVSFDISQTRVFLSSNREGQYNIYTIEKPNTASLVDWFALPAATLTKVDSVNSGYDDTCPIVARNVMIFASNRPGGLGGYDIYFSVYNNGKWGSPVNFGPTINSEADEFRPVLGYHPEFTNYFLVFSSNRTNGKGGFDLYFAGVEIPGEPALISK